MKNRDTITLKLKVTELAKHSELTEKDLPEYLTDLVEQGLITSYVIYQDSVAITAPRATELIFGAE